MCSIGPSNLWSCSFGLVPQPPLARRVVRVPSPVRIAHHPAQRTPGIVVEHRDQRLRVARVGDEEARREDGGDGEPAAHHQRAGEQPWALPAQAHPALSSRQSWSLSA